MGRGMQTHRKVVQQSGQCVVLISLLLIANLDAGLTRAEPIAALSPSDTQTVRTQAHELSGSTSNRAEDLMAEPVVFAPFTDVPSTEPVFGTAPVLAQAPPTGTGEAQQAPPTSTTEPALPDLEADEVVVTGTRRTPEPEPTGTKFTITKDDIAAVGATTIADAIKLAPGINIIDSLGGISSERSTFVRGLDSRRFVFLIDGRPLTRPQDNRAADVGRISASNVERIEVITGGAALRYSADAVAGVINVITNIPEEQFSLRTSNTGGSYGFARHTVDLSGTNGLQRNVAGYLAYEFNYERRSAYNNYTGSFTEVPIGLGIFGVPPDPENPLPRAGFDSESGEFVASPSGQYVQVPITVGTRLNAGYTFNDSYNAKTIFNPAQDHTVTLGFSQLNSRLGDQFALPNQLGTCNVIPENFNRPIRGRVTPPLPPVLNDDIGYPFVFCRPYGPDGSVNPSDQQLLGLGDQAQDDTGAFFLWDWKLSELNLLTTQVSFSSAFNNYPSSQGTKLVSNRSLDAQLRYRAELYPGNTLNTGFQFTTLRYNATPEAGVGPEGVTIFGNQFVPVDRETNRWSIYITEDLRFFDNTLTASLGTRLTNDLLYGTFVTSGAGLRYDFGGPPRREPLTFRVNWSQAFKTPGLSQLFGYGGYNFSGSNGTVPSGTSINTRYFQNSSLRPETATSYDIGFDYRISPSMLFRATHYRIDITNALVDDVYIGTFSTQGGYSAINAQSYASTGFETSFNWKVDQQWSLQASFSTSDSRPKGDAAIDVFPDPETGEPTRLVFGLNGGYFYDYQTFDVPFNTTGIGIRYVTPEFRAAITGQLFGLRPRGYGGPYYYPGYSRWDFTFAFPISPFLTVTAGIFNIFNDRSILAAGNVPIGGAIISPPTTFRVGIESAF